MASISPQTIAATCPGCGAPISVEVWRIVDVGQNPDLKRQLLRGQVNAITCPQCSRLTAVATPLAYHDPEKQLFLVLLPTELGLSGDDQEKTIGELTNALMDSLPAEQRKGYLFQPKTFFSMQSLSEEILRADGITDQMMQDQMEKSQLLQELLAHVDDDASLKTLVEEKKAQLDYEFFLLLTASIEQARQEGDETLGEHLTALRTKLLELVQPPGASPLKDMPEVLTRDELVEQLLSVEENDQLKTLVAVARPLLDYQFFQTLTGQIEAAEGQGEEERAEELTALRTEILNLVDELDQEAKEALDRAGKLLRQILESEDLKAAAEENLEQIDAAFLTVLEANILAADEAGQAEVADKLKKLKEHVVSLLEARLPPEMRLINQLLSTEGHEERRELLQEHRNVIDDQFLKLIEAIVEDLRSQKQETAAEHLGETVKDVKTILRGDHDPSTD
jgi:hypothetical protein